MPAVVLIRCLFAFGLTAAATSCIASEDEITSPFKTEEHWIATTTVENIWSITAGGEGKPPSVGAGEQPGNFKAQGADWSAEISRGKFIWDPVNYAAVVQHYVKMPEEAATPKGGKLLEVLLTPTTGRMLAADKAVSKALEGSPVASVHEDAAFLLECSASGNRLAISMIPGR